MFLVKMLALTNWIHVFVNCLCNHVKRAQEKGRSRVGDIQRGAALCSKKLFRAHLSVY